MSETDQVTGLESALIDRANKLAEEYLANGRQDHERLMTEAKQRLHLEEEHETAAAKTLADRIYQQRVQAAELDLRAELDRLRLELVTAVLSLLPARLAELAADDKRYLPLLRGWLRDGVAAIEQDSVTVQLNAHDLQRVRGDWDAIAREAAPGKRLTLSAEPIPCSGGVLVISADGRIRVDNTFEGREERMSEGLQNLIAEQLAPGAGGN
jgi:V/A-type H+/Na+-transporting ATPase subunit E